MTATGRTKVVVRVREIAETIAAGKALAAQNQRDLAVDAADAAAAKCRVHPLDTVTGPVNVTMLIAATGQSAALLDAARAAGEAVTAREEDLAGARRVAAAASARRQAAERLHDRRVEEERLETERKEQRQLDELTAARWQPRRNIPGL